MQELAAAELLVGNVDEVDEEMKGEDDEEELDVFVMLISLGVLDVLEIDEVGTDEGGVSGAASINCKKTVVGDPLTILGLPDWAYLR